MVDRAASFTAVAERARAAERVRARAAGPALRELYVTGVGALPLVCMVATGTGAAVVLQGTMAPTPPSAELGRMLVVVMIRELAPLLTAILVAGRAGVALAAADEGGDEALGARLWGGAIAVTALAVHFAAVAMVSAYLTSQVVTLRTLDAVREGLEQELRWFDLPLFVLKTGGLGAIITRYTHGFAEEIGPRPRDAAAAASRIFVASLLTGGTYSIGLTVLVYLCTGAPQPP